MIPCPKSLSQKELHEKKRFSNRVTKFENGKQAYLPVLPDEIFVRLTGQQW
jgi:hypothetical protein